MGEWIENPDGTWTYVTEDASHDPAVEESQALPAVEPVDEQEDLSHLDTAVGPLVNTEKVAPIDQVLMQPPQYPDWTPGEEWE